MTASVEVIGLDAMLGNFKDYEKRVGKTVAAAMISGAHLVAGDARRSIQEVSQGETVTRYHEGRKSKTHVASKAGDAPNTDTGQLVKSIQVEPKADAVYVGISRSGVFEYALALEYGNRKGTLKERPFMRPALEKNRKKIKAMVTQALNKQAKEFNK
jgi:HK97 gp10 family phage protein